MDKWTDAYVTVHTSYNYWHLIGGELLPPNENFTSSSSQVITNLSCSLEFTNFIESCKFDFTRDEVCLNHTMDLIVQCSFGRLLEWIVNWNRNRGIVTGITLEPNDIRILACFFIVSFQVYWYLYNCTSIYSLATQIHTHMHASTHSTKLLYLHSFDGYNMHWKCFKMMYHFTYCSNWSSFIFTITLSLTVFVTFTISYTGSTWWVIIV